MKKKKKKETPIHARVSEAVKSLSEVDPREIKGEFLEFVFSPRFSRDIRNAIEGRLEDADEEDAIISFLDAFALRGRTRRGRTFLEVFLQERGDLSPEVKDEILKWREFKEGLFTVIEKDENKLRLKDIIDPDGKEYIAHSSSDEEGFRNIADGSFVLARLLPWRDHYIFSGSLHIFSPEAKEDILEIAEQARRQFYGIPEEEIERIREEQKKMHRAFVEYFGSDEVIFSTGFRLRKELRDFVKYYYLELTDEGTGETLAARYERERGKKFQLPEITFPEEILSARDIGLIFDEEDGPQIIPWYKLLRQIFSEGDFRKIPNYREIILGYLERGGIPRLAMERMAKQNPERVEMVFRDVLGNPDFSLEKDLPKLLDDYN
ncbi:MAG: hypothetical protein ACUVXI_00020 [bacterium]